MARGSLLDQLLVLFFLPCTSRPLVSVQITVTPFPRMTLTLLDLPSGHVTHSLQAFFVIPQFPEAYEAAALANRRQKGSRLYSRSPA